MRGKYKRGLAEFSVKDLVLMEGVPTEEYKRGPTGNQYTGLDTKELITPFRKEDNTLHKAHF